MEIRIILKALSVDHVSVTQIMLKEFEQLKNIMKLLEVWIQTTDITMNKKEIFIFLYITKVSFNLLF